jgi:hypothetical protein
MAKKKVTKRRFLQLCQHPDNYFYSANHWQWHRVEGQLIEVECNLEIECKLIFNKPLSKNHS